MATASEVSVRLSADNSAYRSVMDQTVQVTDAGAKKILEKLDIKAGVSAIAAAVGFNLQSIAEGVARTILGFSKANEEALEETVRLTGLAADAQEKRTADAVVRRKKEQDEVAEAAQRTEEILMRASFAVFDRRKKLEAESTKLRREQNAELSRLDNAAAEARMTSEQKLADWQAQRKVAIKEIGELERKGNQRTTEETQTLIGLKTARQDLEGKIAGATAAAAKDEAKITQEVKEQVKAKQEFYAITTTGRGDRDLSDRELDRKVATLRADIARRQAANPFGFDLLLGPQRSNLSQAEAEQRLRRAVRQSSSFFGEDRAFNMFGGLTEQRFRDIIQQGAADQTQLLGDIKTLLQTKGIKTVPITLPGAPAPGP